jgi:hypothetical protein
VDRLPGCIQFEKSNPDLIEFTVDGVFGVLAYTVILNLGFFFPVTLDRYFSMWFRESRPLVTSLMFPSAWAAVWKIYGYVSNSLTQTSSLPFLCAGSVYVSEL